MKTNKLLWYRGGMIMSTGITMVLFVALIAIRFLMEIEDQKA